MRAAVAAKLDMHDPVSAVDIIDVPDPVATPGQVLVHVRACAINHHDLWTLRGVGTTEDELPRVLGSDVAGVTDDGREVIVHALIADPAAGKGDELLDPNRAMLADALQGGLAAKIVVPERNIVSKPPELSFEEAACLPTAWLTAYRMLFVRGGARPGQTVLVQGAGGGVSTALITLARAAGLRVWVTSRSPEKLESARALGADRGYASGERLPERVDIVLDTVGEATWKHSVTSVASGGVIVVAGATAGAAAKTDLSRIFLHHITVCGTAMGRLSELHDLIALCVNRGIRPHVDSVYPLEKAADALARVASGAAFGKVVVVP